MYTQTPHYFNYYLDRQIDDKDRWLYISVSLLHYGIFFLVLKLDIALERMPTVKAKKIQIKKILLV